MKIKVFTTNEHGNIEMTKAELETLLKDSYREGYMEAAEKLSITNPLFGPFREKLRTPGFTYDTTTRELKQDRNVTALPCTLGEPGELLPNISISKGDASYEYLNGLRDTFEKANTGTKIAVSDSPFDILKKEV